MPDIQISERLISFLTFLPMFVLSITFHEYAHAFVAFKKGDPTAKNMGRLTFNPIKHADLIGTLIMPIASFATGVALIGWAKPVPVDRRNFKNLYSDDAYVSFAGPFANLILALIFYVIFFVFINYHLTQNQLLVNFFWYGVFFNIFLFAFNLLPIPPLDGSHILFDLFPNKITLKILNLGLYGTLILLLFIYSPLWRFFMQLINFILDTLLKVAL
ncbi:MAG TPA: site-2 protease family protein [Ignavibacteriaceae bacterium]|nr:site-2 protease family protein [Ignavibacteriaceae bacterium]